MLTDGENGLDFYSKLTGHPIIAPAGSKPSYVAASQFSTAVIQLLSGGNMPSLLAPLPLTVSNMPKSPFKSVVVGLFRDGEADLSNFETRLQTWFDQTMDRVSGTYKRLSQYLSFGIGLLVAYLFQVNAIAIAYTLWTDPKLREQISDGAANAAAGDQPPSLDQVWPALAHFQFGWETGPTWSAMVGCLISGVAIGLGAPFWFDLLQKFVSLRGTGPVPNKANSQA